MGIRAARQDKEKKDRVGSSSQGNVRGVFEVFELVIHVPYLLIIIKKKYPRSRTQTTPLEYRYNHVPDRKERKEIENLKATIAQLNLERKKSDSKWRLNVKRLESNVRSLEARVGELLDEMDCMNQERLEHLEERQKWEKIRDRKTGAARRVHNTDTEIRDKQMVEVVRQNTKPVVVVEKKPSSSSPPPQIDAKKKEEFVEKKFADGKIERRYSDGRVEMIFRNGTRKVMSTDPSFGGSVSCTIYFSNGDVKRTDPSGT